MKFDLSNILVNDKAKAPAFYAEVVGFEPKHDIPLGTHRWLTVTSQGTSNGTELLVKPDEHPAAEAYSAATKADGMPAASFLLDNLDLGFQRLPLLDVAFVQQPMDGS